MASAPRVSVVVPAHDAEATLADTLESVLAQRYEDWEAIVVDDGSTDATRALAEEYAARDPRVRVLHQAQGGASAARNTGIGDAQGEWLLFLDADDWLLPETLQRLLEIAAADPGVDAAFGLATRVDATGETVVREFGGRDNLFWTAGRACPFAIHSGIVRRSLVERLGRFDPELRTCEDWDLWARAIRSGTRIAHVHEVLAGYRLRPQSLSLDARALLTDGLEVIRRVHAPDPRVDDPEPAYANGLPAADAPAASLGLVGWTAGLALGSGGDPARLLDLVAPVRGPSVDAGAVASGITLAVPIARGLALSSWLELWPELEAPVRSFAAALEERLGTPGFARRMLYALERELLARSEPAGPTRVGTTYVMPLELTDRIEALPPLDGVERLHCFVRLGGTPVGSVQAAVCDGVVSPAVLADRVVAELAWSILGLLHDRTRTPDPLSAEDGRWEFFLQELWGRDWAIADFCDPTRRGGDAQSREVGRGPVFVEVAYDLPDLLTDSRKLAIVPTVAGVPLGIVAVSSSRGVVRAQALRAAINVSAGFELCRVALREGVLGRPLAPTQPLRARLADAAAARGGARRDSRSSTTVILERRTPWEIGTSGSRRASLPVSAVDDVLDAAATASEPVRTAREVAQALVYEPETFEPAPPPEGDGRPPIAVRALRRLLRRERAERLPILMYHRIDDEHGPATARYRIAPSAFAEQLEWLRANGYRTVTIPEWHRAMLTRTPLSGRCVALTFDDGYRDFLTAAWPLLRRQGFSATVLLVTDAVGGTNRWDEAYGDEADLLTWEEIADLQRAGVQFGAHSATHAALTTLSVAEVVREAARARAELQRRLGRVERLFAYPYGDTDELVQHLVGAVGYVVGLSSRPGAASLDDSPLALPRIEVSGGDTIDDLAAKLSYTQAGG